MGLDCASARSIPKLPNGLSVRGRRCANKPFGNSGMDPAESHKADGRYLMRGQARKHNDADDALSKKQDSSTGNLAKPS